MNEAKIAVTIAALLITGAFGGYAFKNLDTNDIVTDKITTVETVKEVTPEEDMTEVETVELTDTAEDTQAKEIYLERSQSSIRSTVVHIEYDDCIYADEESADEVQSIVEYEIGSQAEVNDNESKAQASVEEDSRASHNSEADDISIRYDYFNADVTDTSSDDSSEDDSSFVEASDTKSSSEEEESSEDSKSEELAKDEDSEEEDIAESSGDSESTESTEEAEEFVEDKNGELTESEEEAPEEEENSAEDEESSESEEASENEENADDSEKEEESEESEASTGITVTQSEYYMLCNVVAHEYGSDWVSEYDKALVVEVVMNRVNSPKYPNSIYEVLTQPYQFSGMQSYITLGGFSTQVTESVKAAVDLYLSDPSQFNHGYYSFWGDGYKNHFY